MSKLNILIVGTGPSSFGFLNGLKDLSDLNITLVDNAIIPDIKDECSFKNEFIVGNRKLENSKSQSEESSGSDIGNLYTFVIGDTEKAKSLNLSSIDFKFESSGVSPWNMHRGNNLRNGFFTSSPNMQTGDVNQDLIVDILDIVMLVNFAIATTNPTDNEFYSSDLNSDGVIDVLDVVVLINIILN